MGTVNKQIADEIVAGKYEEDHPVKIVKYTTKWGDEAYGVIFEGDPLDKYAASEFVINPTVYWKKL